MTAPPGHPPVRGTLLSIPGTGGHGPARLDAVTAIVHALGCRASGREPLTGHRLRGAHGDYYLNVWGTEPVITWLNRALPGIIAALDRAAATATRRYAAWLRDECPPEDHMPAERPALRAHWRREYLRAYGVMLAARISGHRTPTPGAPAPNQIDRPHWARPVAERDAARTSLTPYTPRPAVITEDSPLSALPATAAPRGHALELTAHHDSLATRQEPRTSRRQIQARDQLPHGGSPG